MIDRKVQMMDAGMVLFQTEKPFGTVLGGIKTELLKYGKVLRRNEFNESELPETTGECDLFLDWSAPLRKRYISVRLEDAGTVGKTEDGEDIHRYAACLKEGNRCTATRLVLAVGLVLLCGITGAIIPCPDHDNPVSRTGPLPCLQAGRAQPQGTESRQGTPRDHPPGQIARLRDVHLLTPLQAPSNP